jgi:hypothetical protein
MRPGSLLGATLSGEAADALKLEVPWRTGAQVVEIIRSARSSLLRTYATMSAPLSRGADTYLFCCEQPRGRR